MKKGPPAFLRPGWRSPLLGRQVDLPWLDRRLTTVEQPGEAKGRLLGELTRRRLAGEPPTSEAFPVSLRVGDTTAPPP